MRKLIFCHIFILFLSQALEAGSNVKLLLPIKNLFSHEKHQIPFSKLKVSCLDCHSFSVASKEKGPLSTPISEKYLKVDRGVCHRCHRAKISLPRRNQCTLCHENLETLKPKDHSASWRYRHGIRATLDGDRCSNCHKKSECSKCHLQKDNMNPVVHRANFRLTHSITARARPNSCVTCHQYPSFCSDCHSGKRR